MQSTKIPIHTIIILKAIVCTGMIIWIYYRICLSSS